MFHMKTQLGDMADYEEKPRLPLCWQKSGSWKAFLKFVKTKAMSECFFLKHSSPKHPDISTLTASWRKKSWGGRWGTRGAWANPGLVEVPTAIGDESPCSPAMLLLLGGHVCQESHHGIRSHLSKVSCREWQQGTGKAGTPVCPQDL